MATGDRQKFITQLVSKVLRQAPDINKSFGWMSNKHSLSNFKQHATRIETIFNELKGDKVASENKRTQLLKCDAFFGGHYDFVFEFDEFQHFSSLRLHTLERYPDDILLNFHLEDWKRFCKVHRQSADIYRQTKATKDFNFIGGRTAQRAYLDCFKDLLPPLYGLQPTVRISEFEVADIYSNDAASCKKIEALLKMKIT
jgi:hypothetical protein